MIPIIFYKKKYPDSIFNTKKVNCSWSISVAGWNFAKPGQFWPTYFNHFNKLKFDASNRVPAKQNHAKY